MGRKSDLEILQEYDSRIGMIAGKAGDLFTHLNNITVGEKNGNPQLEYKKHSWLYPSMKDLEKWEGLFPTDSDEGKIVEMFRESELKKLLAIDATGTVKFTDAAKEYYVTFPIEADLVRARDIIENTEPYEPPEAEKTVNAYELERRINNLLSRKGLYGDEVKKPMLGWEALVVTPKKGETMAKLAADRITRKVKIRNDYNETEENAERSEKHETIHILQLSPGMTQSLPNAFYYGHDGRCVMTCEGLVRVLLQMDGFDTDDRRWAAYVVAVYDAIEGGASYMDLVKNLKTYGFTDSTAKFMAMRVKRGLHDTSKPGGATLNAQYILGEWAIADSLPQDPEARKERLRDYFVGYVVHDEMPMYGRMIKDGRLKPARTLPDCLE